MVLCLFLGVCDARNQCFAEQSAVRSPSKETLDCLELITNACAAFPATKKDLISCHKGIHAKLKKSCLKINRAVLKKRMKYFDKNRSAPNWRQGLLLLFVFLNIWFSICCHRLFAKANYSKYLAYIPFVNFYTLHQVAGVRAAWFFYNLSPAFIIYWPLTSICLAKSFGYGRAVGKKIATLPFIYLTLLSFSNDVIYQGRGKMPKISFDLKL